MTNHSPQREIVGHDYGGWISGPCLPLCTRCGQPKASDGNFMHPECEQAEGADALAALRGATDAIPPGAHELLAVALRALEARDGNLSMVTGTLRSLLRGGVPLDADCRLLASVLGNATEVSNDPDD